MKHILDGSNNKWWTCVRKNEAKKICMNEIELNGRAQLLYVYYSCYVHLFMCVMIIIIITL